MKIIKYIITDESFPIDEPKVIDIPAIENKESEKEEKSEYNTDKDTLSWVETLILSTLIFSLIFSFAAAISSSFKRDLPQHKESNELPKL